MRQAAAEKHRDLSDQLEAARKSAGELEVGAEARHGDLANRLHTTQQKALADQQAAEARHRELEDQLQAAKKQAEAQEQAAEARHRELKDQLETAKKHGGAHEHAAEARHRELEDQLEAARKRGEAQEHAADARRRAMEAELEATKKRAEAKEAELEAAKKQAEAASEKNRESGYKGKWADPKHVNLTGHEGNEGFTTAMKFSGFDFKDIDAQKWVDLIQQHWGKPIELFPGSVVIAVGRNQEELREFDEWFEAQHELRRQLEDLMIQKLREENDKLRREVAAKQEEAEEHSKGRAKAQQESEALSKGNAEAQRENEAMKKALGQIRGRLGISDEDHSLVPPEVEKLAKRADELAAKTKFQRQNSDAPNGMQVLQHVREVEARGNVRLDLRTGTVHILNTVTFKPRIAGPASTFGYSSARVRAQKCQRLPKRGSTQ